MKSDYNKRRRYIRKEVLQDQRNQEYIRPTTSLLRFEYNLSKLGNVDALSERMLKAAKPYLMHALDVQMMAHPGPLQQSLKPKGPNRYENGGYYLAYRATTGNERPGEKKNQEKMIYLINREYIREGYLPDGRYVENDYVIPADDVILHAVWASENQVLDAMQKEFDKILEEAFDG